MSKRTYKIAEAIMDSAICEYRFVNLKNAESVENYAWCGMNLTISRDESEAILRACRAYIGFIANHHLPNFHGSDDWAIEEWDEIVRKPLLSYKAGNFVNTLRTIKKAFYKYTDNLSASLESWVFFMAWGN